MGNSFVHRDHCGPAEDAKFIPEILHVYQHNSNHRPAALVGNREGLLELRKAIDNALAADGQTASATANVVPADDGEGYSLLVYRVDKPFTDRFWDDLPSTYEIADEPSGGSFAPIEMALRQQWPCPRCHGFGKSGEPTIEVKGHMFMDYAPDAPPCEGPCKGTGWVTQPRMEDPDAGT